MSSILKFEESQIENNVGGTTELALDVTVDHAEKDDRWTTVYFRPNEKGEQFYIVLSEEEVQKIILRRIHSDGCNTMPDHPYCAHHQCYLHENEHYEDWRETGDLSGFNCPGVPITDDLTVLDREMNLCEWHTSPFHE